jgi:hypothetical protein
LLNNCYLPVYNTPEGFKVYSETLDVVSKSFPQYLRELQGTADGAGVEFHKVDEEILKIGQELSILFQLFLFHLDEILPNVAKRERSGIEPTGCTAVYVNDGQNEV